MSDEDSDTPCVSFFSKRAKLTPKKTPEELKAAEELVKKIEVEKNAQMDEALPLGTDAESFGNKAGSSGKKGRKKKIPVPSWAVEKSQADASSQPCECSHSSASSHPCKHSQSPASSVALNDKILDRELQQTRLSAAAKKRIKKFKDDQEFDLMIIEAKNARILEGNPFKRSDLTEEVPTVEEEKEKILKLTVTYLSRVARFNCSENEKFVKMFKDVGDFFNLKPSEFLLCLSDRNIAASDTPKSLGLSETDILECIPYKPDLPSTSAYDDDSLTLTFQSNDSKSKIDLVVNRMEKMQVVMEQYAKTRKIPLSELKFEFDGEKLLGTATPFELDMDTGDCIDVRVFTPMPQCSRASDDQRVFTPMPQCSRASDDQLSEDQLSDDKPSAKNDYFSVYFQDFTFGDSDDSDVIALD